VDGCTGDGVHGCTGCTGCTGSGVYGCTGSGSGVNGCTVSSVNGCTGGFGNGLLGRDADCTSGFGLGNGRDRDGGREEEDDGCVRGMPNLGYCCCTGERERDGGCEGRMHCTGGCGCTAKAMGDCACTGVAAQLGMLGPSYVVQSGCTGLAKLDVG
jgi:hypothetical protein